MKDEPLTVERLLELFKEKKHLPAHHAPIVEHARHQVRCSCGYKHDSAATSEDAAIDDVAKRHPAHGDYELEAARVDYTDHPLYRGKYEHEDAAVKLAWKKRTKR